MNVIAEKLSGGGAVQGGHVTRDEIANKSYHDIRLITDRNHMKVLGDVYPYVIDGSVMCC